MIILLAITRRILFISEGQGEMHRVSADDTYFVHQPSSVGPQIRADRLAESTNKDIFPCRLLDPFQCWKKNTVSSKQNYGIDFFLRPCLQQSRPDSHICSLLYPSTAVFPLNSNLLYENTAPLNLPVQCRHLLTTRSQRHWLRIDKERMLLVNHDPLAYLLPKLHFHRINVVHEALVCEGGRVIITMAMDDVCPVHDKPAVKNPSRLVLHLMNSPFG
mmetsp:Transcript_14742/g.35155  ORF Transcript_14742/g.35155 Transcript_14742/m.35155 type:complete len:217 (+) Transcript_14742:223-873(+)